MSEYPLKHRLFKHIPNTVSIIILIGIGIFIGFGIVELNTYRSALREIPLGDDYSFNSLSSNSSITSNIYLIIVGFLTAIATYLAFQVQWLANRKHREEQNKSRNDIAIERFENRFFAWFDYYRDLTAKMTVNNIGCEKNAFHYMFYEFKHLFWWLTKSQIKHVGTNELLTQDEKTKIAYFIFINGVSSGVNNTIREFCDSLISEEDYNRLIKHVHDIQNADINQLKEMKNKKQVHYINDYIDIAIKTGRNPMWFDGHRQLLIGYFNFFPIIIELILTNKIKGFDALYYLKYIQLALTEHEAGILYAMINCMPEYYTSEVNEIMFCNIISINNLNYRFNSIDDLFLS